eukprot:6691-Heterococcus_DN1.PRE.1
MSHCERLQCKEHTQQSPSLVPTVSGSSTMYACVYCQVAVFAKEHKQLNAIGNRKSKQVVDDIRDNITALLLLACPVASSMTIPSSRKRDGASSVKQTIFLSLLKVTARLATSARTCVLNLVADALDGNWNDISAPTSDSTSALK